jgi:predicted  nucleic acid-binding Zn-ribbon protein
MEQDVTPIIERMRDLQTVDNGIRAAREELEELPKRVAAAREDQAAVEAKLAAAQEELEAAQKERRRLEQEISEIEQLIIKYENDKLKVKTNTEFRALNHQIEGQVEKKSEIETRVLLSFEEEEAATERVRRLQQELAMVEEKVAAREKELKERAAEDERRLAELQDRRQHVVADIEPKLLQRYEVLLERKGGMAVAVVGRGSCGGCHTQQPPQKLAEMRRGDVLHSCDFCGRFLIWEDGITAS